jgi:hypothetical protein
MNLLAIKGLLFYYSFQENFVNDHNLKQKNIFFATDKYKYFST